jgi:hypothetical protein
LFQEVSMKNILSEITRRRKQRLEHAHGTPRLLCIPAEI